GDWLSSRFRAFTKSKCAVMPFLYAVQDAAALPARSAAPSFVSCTPASAPVGVFLRSGRTCAVERTCSPSAWVRLIRGGRAACRPTVMRRRRADGDGVVLGGLGAGRRRARHTSAGRGGYAGRCAG